MKKILMFLSNSYISDPRVYKEAIYLKSLDYNTEIHCWNRNDANLVSEKKEEGFIYRYFYPSKLGKGILKQLIPYLKFLLKIRSVIKKSDCEFLHFHDLDTAIVLLTILKKELKNKCIVLDLHEQPDRLFKSILSKFVYLLLKYTVKKADFVIIVNKLQHLDYKDIYRGKEVILVRNLPENRMFERLEKQESSKFRISFIGSVRDYKTLSILISTFKEKEEYIINIIGHGVAQKQLENEFGGYNNINFIDSFVYNDILKYYEQTDLVFAMYDISNGNYRMAFPVKFFEALACSLPMVVSKDTVVGEFVEKHKIGLVCQESEDLLLQVTSLLKNKNEYDKMVQNINRIKTDYLWESEIENLKKVY